MKKMLKNLSFALTILLLTSCSKADVGKLFEDYLWQNRVLVVFSPHTRTPAYAKQVNEFIQSQGGFKERQIVTWFIVSGNQVVVNNKQLPQLSTPPLYKHFSVNKDEFKVLLLGKDGEVKYKSDKFTESQEIFKIIDAMPMRQNEMQKLDSSKDTSL